MTKNEECCRVLEEDFMCCGSEPQRRSNIGSFFAWTISLNQHYPFHLSPYSLIGFFQKSWSRSFTEEFGFKMSEDSSDQPKTETIDPSSINSPEKLIDNKSRM